jgi:type I restriction enzyme S subunit
MQAGHSDLVIVRPSKELLPKYACLFINSETSQAHVRSVQVGVAQQHFNVGSMKRTPLLLPSLKEQREIVRRVEYLFAVADKAQAQYQTARTQVDKLTPALLAMAFRGELVPQYPTNEPAEQLLARIGVNASSATSFKQKRGAKAPVKKQSKEKRA